MDWATLTIAEQLGNIGSEFERAVRWKQRGRQAFAWNAAVRTLAQLDKTLTDSRHAGHRRREIARLRDEVCDVLFSDQLKTQSAQQLQRYFMAFATAARKTSRP